MMGGAKLSVLKNLYHRLDATFYFLERLPNNSLFRLLNIKDADLLVSFTKSVLTCYDLHLNIITIEGHTLGVKSGTSYPGCEDDKCREKYQEAAATKIGSYQQLFRPLLWLIVTMHVNLFFVYPLSSRYLGSIMSHPENFLEHILICEVKNHIFQKIIFFLFFFNVVTRSRYPSGALGKPTSSRNICEVLTKKQLQEKQENSIQHTVNLRYRFYLLIAG